MYRYADGNYSAYAPDLPGCVAAGETRDEAERLMREAIGMHVRGLLEDGLPIPRGESSSAYMAVAA